ncbi:hypothetical protein BASA81_010027 [Batrachochytrium salamandrivorans]|nr:hypothetical protein BASA81_010027 [Batrachochytrium salamandrivorans]
MEGAAWANVGEIVRVTFGFVLDKLKALSDQFRQQLELSGKLELELKAERESRVRLEQDLALVKAQLAELSRALPHRQELSSVLTKKVDTKTLQTLLEDFPDRAELAVGLDEMRDKFVLELGRFQTDLAAQVQSQMDAELAFMRNAVTCEMLLGRWTFHCDRNGVDSLRESVNTSQVLFQLDQSRVKVLKSGIFQISLVCFGADGGGGGGVIQLAINDHVVFSNLGAVPTPSPPTPPSGLLTPFPHRPHNNSHSSRSPSGPKKSPYAGWSHVEHVSLPESGGDISLRYRGDPAHGVLTIRNLHCFE